MALPLYNLQLLIGRISGSTQGFVVSYPVSGASTPVQAAGWPSQAQDVSNATGWGPKGAPQDLGTSQVYTFMLDGDGTNAAFTPQIGDQVTVSSGGNMNGVYTVYSRTAEMSGLGLDYKQFLAVLNTEG